MTEEKKNQLSRRDALKVLGAAAGATALANLPSKWNSPELLSGVLPAHAQTSANLLAGPDTDILTCYGNFTSTVSIIPVRENIQMRWIISNPSGMTINTPGSLTGTALTDATGVASLLIDTGTMNNGNISVTWSFENIADGSGTDDQVFYGLGGC